jgi:hypothetical protein
MLVGWGVCLLAFQVTGCASSMQRRMTIRSEPPGAMVMIEGEELGYTPVSMDFTYYGTREITLVLDGYETLTVMQKVPAPWYQHTPLEFVTDNFSPVKIRDRHDFTFTMQRQVIYSNQELLERGNGLRSEAQIAP